MEKSVIEQSTTEIPPGLVRLVKGAKPSKKFYVLIGISSLLLIIAFAALLFYYFYFEPKSFNTAETRNNQLSLSSSNNVSQSSSSSESRQEAIPKPQSAVSLGIPKVDKQTEQTAIANRQPQSNSLATQAATEKVSSEKADQRKDLPDKAIDSSEGFKGVDFLYRAMDYEQRGLYLEAIAEYKQYISHTGREDGRLLNKIAALYLSIGNLKEAEYYSQLAIKDGLNNSEILINYGVIKAKLGDTGKAEESFIKVLTREPENKTALFNLALIKEKRGEYSEALKYYQKLLELGDKNMVYYIERLKIKR